MSIPLWDSWLWGGDVFTALLPSVRFLWLSGNYGSGKTVLATFLGAHLLEKGLVSRVISNLEITGASPVMEYVSENSVYRSEYLDKYFHPGDLLPLEDTAIIFDEAALFLENWSAAKDYFMALRKTNLYFLMPSIWPPAARIKIFEVRRSLNCYAFGIPAWKYDWWMANGRSTQSKGSFFIWRPHRLFGISKTLGFPKNDGGIADLMAYTFDQDKIDEHKRERSTKRAIRALNLDSGEISDSVAELTDSIEQQTAWAASLESQRKRKRG